jgi:uncharacterized protein YvpB
MAVHRKKRGVVKDTKQAQISPVAIIVLFVILGITAAVFLFGNDKLLGRQFDILTNEIEQYEDANFAYDTPYLVTTGTLSVSYSNGDCWYCGAMRDGVDSSDCRGMCCRSNCPSDAQILPNVPYYNQCGLENNRRLCETACGPTSLKMGLGYYGRDVSIHTLYRKAGTYRLGTEITRLASVAEDDFNLGSEVIYAQDRFRTQNSMWEFLQDEIAEGNPVIIANRISERRETCATNSGHYFLLVGISEDKAIVNDPYTGIQCGQEVGNHIVLSKDYLFSIWNRANYRAVPLDGQRGGTPV